LLILAATIVPLPLVTVQTWVGEAAERA